jgi:hypothetical protein
MRWQAPGFSAPSATLRETIPSGPGGDPSTQSRQTTNPRSQTQSKCVKPLFRPETPANDMQILYDDLLATETQFRPVTVGQSGSSRLGEPFKARRPVTQPCHSAKWRVGWKKDLQTCGEGSYLLKKAYACWSNYPTGKCQLIYLVFDICRHDWPPERMP